MAMASRPSSARPFAAPSFFPGDLLPVRVDHGLDQDERRYKDAFLWHSAGKGSSRGPGLSGLAGILTPPTWS